MEHDTSSKPDRREFVRRLGTAAAYGVPVFAALGAARPQERSSLPGSESTAEEIARHWEEAAKHLVEADRLGSRYRFQDRDWEILKPALKEVTPPIKRFPPDWCAIC